MGVKRSRREISSLPAARRFLSGILAVTSAYETEAPQRALAFSPREAPMRFGVTKSWGMILLAVWLILSGLIPLLSIHIDRSGTFMNVLAVAAGVLVLFGR
jgi:hypothetical protein